MKKQVMKKGDVYKVICAKSGDKTLLVNCSGCDRFVSYDKESRILDCKSYYEGIKDEKI